MTYQFQFRRYRLPFRAPVRTAHGAWTEREGVIVRLEDERGAAGLGEAAPIPWFGSESADEIEIACRSLSTRLTEQELALVPERLASLRNALANARQEVGAQRSTQAPEQSEAGAYVAVAALLPAGRMALAQIAGKTEIGFRIFKWKVGVGAVGDELALLDDLCALLPEGAKLRLDANGAWDRRAAERWLDRCAERPVEFVEQPIAATARGAEDILRGLAADYPTALALDESLVHDGDIERWLGNGWLGVFVVKPSLLADPAHAVAELEKRKADVVFSSALETAIGARAALRLALAWNGERRAVGFGVFPLFADGRFDGPGATPFVYRADVERIDPEAVWNALS